MAAHTGTWTGSAAQGGRAGVGTARRGRTARSAVDRARAALGEREPSRSRIGEEVAVTVDRRVRAIGEREPSRDRTGEEIAVTAPRTRRHGWLGLLAVLTGAAAALWWTQRADPGAWARWLERAQRLPVVTLGTPDRSSLSLGGGAVGRIAVSLRTLEAHRLATNSPVIAIAERSDAVAVVTFDDGLCLLAHGVCRNVGLGPVVNDVVAGERSFFVASADGAFWVEPDGRTVRLAPGAFTAVTIWRGQPWWASAQGISTLDRGGFVTFGAEHGLGAERPSALAACGRELCVGAEDGLWTFDGRWARRHSSASGELPEDFVTAVSGGSGEIWVGTFSGGLAELTGAAPRRMGLSDGLPDGRIEPRAFTTLGSLALAGTPSGLLVAESGRVGLTADGLPDPEVTAVRAAKQGVWLGYRGGVRRVEVVLR